MAQVDKNIQTVQENPAFWNDIFICYCEADELFADKFAKFLKRYRPPAELKEKSGNRLKVVKDEISLGGSEYKEFIEAQLRHSRKLIVVCSPAARNDKAVNEKIQRFKEQRGVENIIPVIVDGLPNNRVERENDEVKAYPESLCRDNNNLLSQDYTDFDLRESQFHRGAYEKEWYTLLSRIYDIDRTAMAQLDRNRRFEEKRRKLLAVITIVVLAAALIIYQSWKSSAREAARQKSDLTRIVSDLREKSLHARLGNDILLSLHLAAEAVSIAPDEKTATAVAAEIRPYEPVAMLACILKHEGEIIGACFNRDQTRILTWSNDSTARLWDISGGKEVFPSLRHEGWVYGALFSGDERQILTWSTDSTIRRWDASSGKPLSAPLLHSGEVTGMILNRDESRVLSWCNDFSVHLWDLRGGQALLSATRHAGWINGARFTEDELQFVTWSDDSTARRWDVSSGNPAGAAMRHKGAVNGLLFYDGDSRVITWSNDSTARVWDVSGSEIGSPLQHRGEVIGACFNNSRQRLLTWGRDNAAHLWDINNRREVLPPLQHDGWVLGAAFNHDESRILTWSHDNTARLWDVTTGKQIGAAMPHSSGPLGNDAGVFGAAFGQSETHALTWGDDNTARLWNLESGEQLGPSMQHDNSGRHNHEIEGALFSADLNTILTWSSDSTARLWKTASSLHEQLGAAEGPADPDFPREQYPLQIKALTGTEYDPAGGEVKCIEAERWRKLNEEYLQIARKHYRDCSYPRQNLWRKFYPEEAQQIRSPKN